MLDNVVVSYHQQLWGSAVTAQISKMRDFEGRDPRGRKNILYIENQFLVFCYHSNLARFLQSLSNRVSIMCEVPIFLSCSEVTRLDICISNTLFDDRVGRAGACTTVLGREVLCMYRVAISPIQKQLKHCW